VRIAYLAGWPGGPDTGPFKKIAEQTRLWRDLGAEVGLFVLTTEDNAAAWRGVPAAAEVIVRSGNAPSLTLQKERLIRAAISWGPDVLYHRYSLAYPGLVRAVRKVPVVVEINTDDVSEYRLIAPRKATLNQLTRGLVLGRAAGFVAVTDELAQAPSFVKFDRPTAVVANGIDLDEMPQLPAPALDRPTLAFIGQPNCPWHGLDKVVELARVRPGWDVDVVGPDHAEVVAAAGTPPSNVRVHGLLAAADYLAILSRAHIGIGSLALHRKEMSEASTLKLREYLAVGLPSVIGYRDTDFPGGADFLLELPNVETNVRDTLPAIDDFVSSRAGTRVERVDIGHIDSRAKEQRRLDFLRQASGRA
jgi:hypothetical protein